VAVTVEDCSTAAPIETPRHGVLVTARRTARGIADGCSEQRGLRATCLPIAAKRGAISL
jgi:hypothetical protein